VPTRAGLARFAFRPDWAGSDHAARARGAARYARWASAAAEDTKDSGTTVTKPIERLTATVASPLRAFLHAENAGGIVLVAAAVAALVWANSPAADGYAQFWHQTISVGAGPAQVTEDLQHWVNDGLMAIFFFVIGLEIKRELVVGELREPRAAALPVLAAIGGVVLPAVIYLTLVGAGEPARGWGIPMATDIAFAVGILALLGRRASTGAKLFLLSVAIVDDIIAILVIAVFYSGSINFWWLAGAVVGLLAVVGLRRLGVVSPWGYVPVGIVVWVATLESGVHATLAGVALGMLTPARPVGGRDVLDDLEHALHPVSAFLIIPIFALANAGVDVRGGALGAAFGQQLTWAVIVGLVVGKIVGIAGVAHVVRWRRWGALPADMHGREIVGVAALGGIGFTVSLFIADLAFDDAGLIAQAKVGILTASLAAALIGTVLLLLAPAGTGATSRSTTKTTAEVG
jgi:NhaA family Na+:H+ antiporter